MAIAIGVFCFAARSSIMTNSMRKSILVLIGFFMIGLIWFFLLCRNNVD